MHKRRHLGKRFIKSIKGEIMGNEDYLIKNVSLFDTLNGDISVSDLAIKNGRVTSPDLLKDPKIKDGTGLITMFGIWDCHSHPGSLMYDNFAHGYFESAAARTIRAGSNLIEAARLGITGVRALSEANQIDIEWGKTFKDGGYKGPRVLSAGAGIRVTGGHGTAYPRKSMDLHWELAADGPAEMSKLARTLIEEGVNWLKLMLTGGLFSEFETVEDNQFTTEELSAVMEVANNKNIPVAAHCGGARTAEKFAVLGGKSIEHGYALDEKSAKVMAENGTWLVPTISVTQDTEMHETDQWPKHAMERAKIAGKKHVEALQACVAAGVKIATGADYNPIGPRMLRELELLEKAGMSRLQVIHAATSAGKELNGYGVESKPEVGSVADLIFMRKNPIEDISNFREIEAVMSFGRFIIEPN